MIRTLAKNWWLLTLCGALDAAISAIYLVMARTDGPVLSHTWGGTILLAGKLTMAAGACTLAAAFWKSRGGRISWPLALNGAALVALGFIQYALTRFPIGIGVVAALVALATVAIGIVETGIARTSWREHRSGDGWLFSLAGIGSAAFVLVSIAFGLRLIPMGNQSHIDLVWLGLYFAFAAICTIALGVRMHGLEPSAAAI